MLILVQGPENSGKSRFAEDLSVKIRTSSVTAIKDCEQTLRTFLPSTIRTSSVTAIKDCEQTLRTFLPSTMNRGGLVYIATMLPVGDGQSGTARILRHRAQRDGLGFATIEKPLELSRLDLDPDCTVLLEDIANLTGNYMFMTAQNGSVRDAFDDVRKLAGKCLNLVMVSLTGLSQSEEFDEATNEYIAGLALINKRVFELSDVVVSVKNGEATVEKGTLRGYL